MQLKDLIISINEHRRQLAESEMLSKVNDRTEIFVDMDGVLADFFGDWARLAGVSDYRNITDPESALALVRDAEDFWLNLPKTQHADKLLDLVISAAGSYKILSTPLADDPRSGPHKLEWVKQNLQGRLPAEVILSHNKEQHATQPDGTPNILIDDYGVNIRKWEAAGGIGFKHKDHKFERTVDNIKKHLHPASVKENSTGCSRTRADLCQCESINKITESAKAITAVCQLEQSDTVKGALLLKQQPGKPTLIVGQVTGLQPGKHGVHIHEFGDLSQGCKSAGDHYNPDGVVHGGLEKGHVGDLENIIANKNGIADVKIIARRVDLIGERSVVGRSIVIHQDPDDLGQGGDAESLKTGNAGERLACGVIVLKETLEENTAGDREIAIHRSSEDFQHIDLSKSADGTFWLSSPQSQWDNIVTTGRGVDHVYEISPTAKLASWDHIDKYSVDELEQMGYDGVRMVDGDDITYQIWNTSILKRTQLGENFADGKVKGKSRPGRAKRAGVDCGKSITDLRKIAKNSSGEKQKMAHWCANMKSGRAKKNK